MVAELLDERSRRAAFFRNLMLVGLALIALALAGIVLHFLQTNTKASQVSLVNGREGTTPTDITLNPTPSPINTNTNANKTITRADMEKNKERYGQEAKSSGRKIGSGENDMWLWVKTRYDLAAADDLRDSTINVDVDNGVVTLTGDVASQAQVTKADSVAKAVEGVKSVRNMLKVSAGDGNNNNLLPDNNGPRKVNQKGIKNSNPFNPHLPKRTDTLPPPDKPHLQPVTPPTPVNPAAPKNTRTPVRFVKSYAASDSPTPEPSPPPVERSVIESEWPKKMYLGNSDTVRISIVRATNSDYKVKVEVQGHEGTYCDIKIPGGIPNVPIEKAFGDAYQGFAVATLTGAADSFSITPPTQPLQPLDGSKVDWPWVISPKSEGEQVLLGSVEVQWQPKEGKKGKPFKQIVCQQRMAITVKRPWVTSGQLNIFSILTGISGSTLFSIGAFFYKRFKPPEDKPPDGKSWERV